MNPRGYLFSNSPSELTATVGPAHGPATMALDYLAVQALLGSAQSFLEEEFPCVLVFFSRNQ
jgi:hypothetical protein